MKRSKKTISDYFDEPFIWETIETDDGETFVNINSIWELRQLCEDETADHHEAFDLTASALEYCERSK